MQDLNDLANLTSPNSSDNEVELERPSIPEAPNPVAPDIETLSSSDENLELTVPPAYEDQVLENNGDVQEQISLESLASFDFEDASQQTPGLDETDEKNSQALDIVPADSSDEMTVEVGKKQLYQNPIAQLATAAVVACVLFSGIGNLIGGATNVGGDKEDKKETVTSTDSDVEEEEENDNNNLPETNAELATRTLGDEVKSNNEAIKNREKERAQSTNSSPSNVRGRPVTPGRTTRIPDTPSNSRGSGISRLPFPERTTVPPVQDSRSAAQKPPTRAVTQVPQSLPSISNGKNGAQPSPPVEQPTMLALGEMPGEHSNVGSGENSVTSPDAKLDNESSHSQGKTLNTELSAFMGGAKIRTLNVGDSFSGVTTTNAVAVSDTKFQVKVTGGDLDGAVIVAKVSHVTGKTITAMAESINLKGREYPLEDATITGIKGKRLKAKKNKGFFQSSFGKALIGAGSGAANQATAKAESFTQFENGGFTQSKAGGSDDTKSLVFGAINGFTDPLLNVEDPENTAFLQVNTSVELHIFKGQTIHE